MHKVRFFEDGKKHSLNFDLPGSSPDNLSLNNQTVLEDMLLLAPFWEAMAKPFGPPRLEYNLLILFSLYNRSSREITL